MTPHDVMLMALLGLARQQSGLATMYYPGDKSCGVEKADGTPFTIHDEHIAHRWLPLGTTGYLCNFRNQQCAITVVRDRGPFGSIKSCSKGEPAPYEVSGKVFLPRKIKWNRKCYWWQAQVRLQKGFKYRGTFDITRPLAKKIAFRAFDRVVFFYGVSGWKRQKRVPFPAHLVSATWSGPNKMSLEKDWRKYFAELSN
jgi:hypothetical protein